VSQKQAREAELKSRAHSIEVLISNGKADAANAVAAAADAKRNASHIAMDLQSQISETKDRLDTLKMAVEGSTKDLEALRAAVAAAQTRAVDAKNALTPV
jgi:chromosome segregation ATPase